MDDLSPIDDRDGLEGNRVCNLSVCPWARPGMGDGVVVTDTHRQVCLQLSLNLLPVVFVVVHLVIAHHIEVQ